MPPHVVVENQNIGTLKQLVYDSINYIKASTIEELKLKLCVFTDDLDRATLVSSTLFHDLKYKIQVNFESLEV